MLIPSGEGTLYYKHCSTSLITPVTPVTSVTLSSITPITLHVNNSRNPLAMLIPSGEGTLYYKHCSTSLITPVTPVTPVTLSSITPITLVTPGTVKTLVTLTVKFLIFSLFFPIFKETEK